MTGRPTTATLPQPLDAPFREMPRPRREQLLPVVLMLVNIALAILLGALTAIDRVAALALALGAVAIIGIAFRPNLATFLALAILYSNAAAIAVQLHGWPYPIAAALPLVLLIPLANHLLVRREPLVTTPALSLILLLFVAELVSTVMSRDPGSAADALFKFAVEGVFLVAAITNVVRDLATVRRAVWVLLFVGAGLGVLSLVQQATGDFNEDFFGFAQVSRAVIDTGPATGLATEGQPRLAGPIGEKNRYAQILLVLLPLAFTRIWDERSRLLKVVAALCAVAIGAGIALTFSRGAAVGFGMMVLVMIALRYVNWKQIAVVALGAVLLLTAFPTYGERLLTIESITGATSTGGQVGDPDDSIRSRANEMLAAGLAFADHPIVGTGPGLFPSYYPRYATQIGIKIEHTDRAAHNLYLQEAAEGGIIGLSLFLAIVGVVLRDLLRARRRWLKSRPDVANLASGFALAIVAYLGSGLFLHLAFERYYWLLIALSAATAWIALQPDPDEEPA
ncbi:MAG TPA: O-antigen ligase family protein [Candidatus Limnocylindrales bacterium]|nr:O-antigen ligase family protein [Candidatus Limnocylindrales bacterium]